MNGTRRQAERRQWSRLPLAIPVFVRNGRDTGTEFLEFATALNVGAGGMLIAIRKPLRAQALIRLEIPSAPVAAQAATPQSTRTLVARTLRTVPAQGCYLVGLKFSRPLLLAAKTARRKKSLSTV